MKNNYENDETINDLTVCDDEDYNSYPSNILTTKTDYLSNVGGILSGILSTIDSVQIDTEMGSVKYNKKKKKITINGNTSSKKKKKKKKQKKEMEKED